MYLDPVTLVLMVFILRTVDGQDMRFATDCMTPNREIGYCIEIHACKRLLDQVILNNTDSYEFIRASRCGPTNENTMKPKVCCGSDINFSDIGTDFRLDTESEMTHTTPLSPSSYDILPNACGNQTIFLGNRIYGGEEADVGEFPWLARLVHWNKYNKTKLGCSGFLIHPRFVLTAAHCLIGPGISSLGELQGVILGMHNDTRARICTEDACTDPPLPIKALEVKIHAGYDSNVHTHDIALIPLAKEVSFTDFIGPICLPNITTNATGLYISGWGRTEKDASSRTKLKVQIPMFNHTKCSEKYKSLGLSISRFQVCAGGEDGHDSCAGDSGGPLMALNHKKGLWEAEGIVSFGNSCGRKGWPGVYTSIPAYYNWIISSIGERMKYLNL